VDRAQGLRRATWLTGLLAAFGVAGSLAVAGVAYTSRDEAPSSGGGGETATTVDGSTGSDNGSAWPELSGGGDDQSHVTSGGS
jgi:hypothetical protein